MKIYLAFLILTLFASSCDSSNTPTKNAEVVNKRKSISHKNAIVSIDTNTSLHYLMQVARDKKGINKQTIRINDKKVDYLKIDSYAIFNENETASIEVSARENWIYFFNLYKIDSLHFIMKPWNIDFPLDIPEYLFMPNLRNGYFFIDKIKSRILFFAFGGDFGLLNHNLIKIVELDRHLKFINELEIVNSEIDKRFTYDIKKEKLFIYKTLNGNPSMNFSNMNVSDLYEFIATTNSDKYFQKVPTSRQIENLRIEIDTWLMDNAKIALDEKLN